EGWGQDSKTKATYKGHVDFNECDEIAPITPEATQAVCEAGGTFSTPKLTPEDGHVDDNGISYAYDGTVAVGETVTITATLPDSGKMWADDLGNGWERTSNTTAEWSVEFIEPECGTITPAEPDVTQAVCETGGAITPPNLSVGPTDNVTYDWDADEVVNGGDVVITATLSGANEWGDLSGTGWTENPDDATKATYTVHFENIECGTISPATPGVRNAVC